MKGELECTNTYSICLCPIFKFCLVYANSIHCLSISNLNMCSQSYNVMYFTFSIRYSTGGIHVMHPESRIQLVSLTACASNQILQHLSLYGGNCRGRCGGGESAETGLIIIRQDALCPDFGLSKSEIQCLPPRIH